MSDAEGGWGGGGLHRKARPEITAGASQSCEAIITVPIDCLPERNGGTKGDQILAQGKRSFLTQSPNNRTECLAKLGKNS